jgi:hypothetical protein
LPRNGKHISYKQISHAIQHAYNLAPSLADQLTASAYQLDQGRGWIDLQDLSALNVGHQDTYPRKSDSALTPVSQVIQHDASFTRPDIAFCPDQSVPHPDLVDRFLSHASNDKFLSLDDIVYFSGLRRAESKRSNGQYSMTWSFLHKFFGMFSPIFFRLAMISQRRVLYAQAPEITPSCTRSLVVMWKTSGFGLPRSVFRTIGSQEIERREGTR